MLTWGWGTAGVPLVAGMLLQETLPNLCQSPRCCSQGRWPACGCTAWFQSVQAFQNEIDRNRNRVKEIFQYIDNLQEQLDSIELLEPPE